MMFGVVAGVSYLASTSFYLRAILRGETKPARVTWWIWTAIGITILASYGASGASIAGMIIPALYVTMYATVAVLSLRYGVGGTKKGDVVAGVIAGVSLLLWWRFGAEVALVANVCADLAAILPTVRKAYREPETENRLAWTICFVASVINLFAVERWTLAIAVLPMYYVGTNGLIALLTMRARKKKI